MAWGMLLKGAVKGLTRKAAVGAGKKMLGGGKKKQPQQQQQPPSDGGGGDVGGALVKAGSSAIIPTGVKSSALAISQTSAGGGGGQDLEGTVLRIKTSVIKVENLLAGSAALQEKQREDARKAKEAADAAAAEGQLEKPKDKKQKFTIPQPKIVKSFWEKMKAFFLNTLLGWITVRLLPFIDKMAPVIKLIVGIGSWILKIAGWVFNALVTAIDWAYKLYEGARKWVGDTFGEQALEWFDKLSGALNTLINGFIVWKLIGERIFKAAVGAIKGAWNLARNITKGVINIGKNIGKGIRRIMHPKKTAEAMKRLNNLKKIKKAKQLAKLQKAQKIKNIGKLRKVAKVKGVAGKGAGLAAKGAGKVGGLAAKIFGKSAGAISGAFKGAQPFISKFFGRVPIIGPLVVGIVSILSGDPVGQALFKTMGAALGGFLGTFIPIPILGTLIGETLGVFVGDLLYTLMFGGGMKAVGQKLKDTMTGILKAGTAVKDWVTGGFGRFIETFEKENKAAFGLTNWLNLLNPLITLPLLVKSFFPPGGDKESGTKDSATPSESLVSRYKSRKDKKFGTTKYYIKGKELTEEQSAPFVEAANEERINAVSKEASYEETVVSPPMIIKEGDGEKTSERALKITSGILLSRGGAATDAYEKLYVGGLA